MYRMYKVRDYGCGRFIAIPPEMVGYDRYYCHENVHRPGDFVFSPVKDYMKEEKEEEKKPEEFSYYEDQE